MVSRGRCSCRRAAAEWLTRVLWSVSAVSDRSARSRGSPAISAHASLCIYAFILFCGACVIVILSCKYTTILADVSEARTGGTRLEAAGAPAEMTRG